MKAKKSETLSFKITEEFKENLQKLADEENRTMSNFVINILTEYVEKVNEAKRLLEKR